MFEGLRHRIATAAARLVGPDGKTVEAATLAEEIGGPTVTGVRPVIADHPAAGISPGRLAALLRDAEMGDATAYLELAEDIEERDPHLRAVLATRKLAVSQLPMTVVAASDDTADQRAADLVREWQDASDIEEDIFDLMDGLGKGFGASELVWDTTGHHGAGVGRWWPTLSHREARYFQFDVDDGTTLRLRDGSAKGDDLAPWKWVIHRPKTKSGFPIRGGLARAAAWPYLFKNYALKDWVIFLEVYGHPLRLGKYGPDATAADKAVLLRAVRDLGVDAAAIIPQSMMIEFVTAAGKADAAVFREMAEYMDQQISKLVLGQTATTDAINGGHAVGKTHQTVREDIERADGRQVAATLNRQLVPALVSFNLGPRRVYPKIIIGRPDEEDIDGIVDRFTKLAPFGLTVGASVMRDKIGLPDPGKDEEVLRAPAAPPSEPPPSGGKDRTPKDQTTTAAAGGAQVGSDPRPVDDLIDAALDDWQPSAKALVDPVLAAVAAANTAEELQAALAEIAGTTPDALVEALAQAGFVARAAARAGYGDDDSGGDQDV